MRMNFCWLSITLITFFLFHFQFYVPMRSVCGYNYFRQSIFRGKGLNYLSFRCHGIKRKPRPDDEFTIDPSWTKVELGRKTSKNRQLKSIEEFEDDENMERRLAAAKDWEKFLVNDEDAAEINKMIGFSEPVQRVKTGKVSLSTKSSQPKGRDGVNKQLTISSKKKGLLTSDDGSFEGSQQDLFSLRDIRGFLDMNPFLCTGCGTAFQCKKSDSPGFLPEEKFLLYRHQAHLIQKQQKAVKILNLAGIDLDSDMAEQTLREAGIELAVIQGVRRLGKRLQGTDISQEQRQEQINERRAIKTKGNFRDRDLSFDPTSIGIINELDPDTNEQKFISMRALDSTVVKTSGFKETENAEIHGKDLMQDNEFISLKKVQSDVAPSSAVVESLVESEENEAADLPKRAAEVGEERSKTDNSLEDALPICQRCFRLQQYGQVEQALRPGWTENELLTPERFASLLSSIRTTETAVLCIVDVFDLSGSLLPNLKEIVGPHNPLFIAVNKLDLLPRDISQSRVRQWVYSEIKRICGFQSHSSFFNQKTPHLSSSSSSPRRVTSEEGEESVVLKPSNIHLISCSTGLGFEALVKELVQIAPLHGKKIHVLGAANVGKSSFINRLLNPPSKASKPSSSAKANNKRPLITVSNLPGTTLDFVKIKLSNDILLIDTPGLINRGHLTSRLTTEELKEVIPVKPINAITLRVEEGRAILLGGLARLEMVEGKPFFFTFFLSNAIKIHPTHQNKTEAFLEKHLGQLIFPPHSVERYSALKPFQATDFTITGDGWGLASTDIVIPGLGWIAVTGVGVVKVRVIAPEGCEVNLRPALLPFEARHTTAKFTGGRLEKRSKKAEKSYGWRA